MIRSRYLFIFIFFITVVFFLVDLTVGSVNIPLCSVWSKESIYSSIFYEIRLPKAFTSLLITTEENVQNDKMKALSKVLDAKEIKTYVEETYEGAYVLVD